MWSKGLTQGELQIILEGDLLKKATSRDTVGRFRISGSYEKWYNYEVGETLTSKVIVGGDKWACRNHIVRNESKVKGAKFEPLFGLSTPDIRLWVYMASTVVYKPPSMQAMYLQAKRSKKGRKKGAQSGGFTVALFLALFASALLLYLVSFTATKFISSLLDPFYITELKREKRTGWKTEKMGKREKKKGVKKGGKRATVNDPIHSTRLRRIRPAWHRSERSRLCYWGPQHSLGLGFALWIEVIHAQLIAHQLEGIRHGPAPSQAMAMAMFFDLRKLP
ncbi:hypothetical protein C8F04DRAFT_1189181 [Mycena alexandri]|uniref:Uncharacterized protein n=1 Tax=Mycena alexandri TaxID=1745969 RepID=A0AAD6X0I0_9AGAR|nr:hypothetical protein C8F04DRAFT_1189181 [Mycena alexandri]